MNKDILIVGVGNDSSYVKRIKNSLPNYSIIIDEYPIGEEDIKTTQDGNFVTHNIDLRCKGNRKERRKQIALSRRKGNKK